MSDNRLNHRNQRYIIKRLIIHGNLILDTPTCLGDGDADDLIDLMVLRDSISDHALLTGSSIAGALRSYLFDYNNELNLDIILFGGRRQDDDGDQSPLIINDSISSKPIQSELRDGVKIDSKTRTVDPNARAKYDLELLQPGTEFPLSFELLIDKNHNEQELINALAIALQGLEPKNGSQSGEISLGMKKRRGFGQCHVKQWQVWYFNLEDAKERMAWLKFEHWRTDLFTEDIKSIQEAFTQAKINVNFDELSKKDQRNIFTIHATFNLATPLLIRSGHSETGKAPDVVHLKSYRSEQKKAVPVLPGTSLAGVLRHRSERILNTLGKPATIIDDIFGPDATDKTKPAKASRLIVHESVIENAADLVQTRIAIDRFTGGAYHGALFQEQPIFPNNKTKLVLKLELRNPKEYEIGLLLLLLKDLWTSDLPVGGTSSIGRGRLKGKCATITDKDQQWKITKDENGVHVSNPHNSLQSDTDLKQELQDNFVAKLVNYVEEKKHEQSDS